MADNIKGITIQFKGDSANFDKSAQGVRNALKLLKSEAKQFDTALKFNSKDVDALKGKLKNLEQQEKLLVSKTKDLKRQLENLEPGEVGGAKWTALRNQLNNAENDLAKVRVASKKTEQALQDIANEKVDVNIAQAESKLNKLSNQMNNVGEKFKNAGDKVSSVGSAMMPVTAAMGGVAAASVKTAMTFESSMSEVKAISGATGDQFEALKNKAKQLGADTAFSSQEAASAMVEMGKAGWTTKDMLEGMDGVMDAAAASGTDLATTSTIVADAVSTFGLEAKESSRVADVLAQAANAGTIGMEELAESFKYVGPVATGLGVSIEDTSGALVALSQAGIKGSQAGTTLKNVLLRLSAPTDEVQGAINKTGLVVNDASGNFVGLNSILTQLRESTQGMTDTQKMAIASQIAGKEAASGLSALLSMNDAEYKKLTESMANCNGQAKQTAQTMRDNLSGDIDAAKGSIENLGITLGEILTPYLRQAAQAIQEMANKVNEWAEKFKELSPTQQDMIVKMGLLVTAIGPVTLVVGKVISVFGSLMTAMSTIGSTVLPVLSAAFGGLSAPVLAIVAAVGALVATIVDCFRSSTELQNLFANEFRIAFSNAKNSLDQVWQAIQAFLNPVLQSLASIYNNTLKPAVTAIIAAFGQFFGAMNKVWAWINSNLGPIFRDLASIIGNVLGIAFDGLQIAINAVIAVISGCVNAAKQLWAKFKETWIFKQLSAAFEAMQPAINAVKSVIDQVAAAFDWLKQKASEAVDFVNSKLAAIADGPGGKKLFDAGGFGGTFTYAFDASGLGGNINKSFNAGGFGSNGDISLTTNININNKGESLSKTQAKMFARSMVAEIDKELGRKVRLR